MYMPHKILVVLFLGFSLPTYGMQVFIDTNRISEEQKAALIRVASTESLPEQTKEKTKKSFWCCCRSRKRIGVTVAVVTAGALVALAKPVQALSQGISTVERIETVVDKIGDDVSASKTLFAAIAAKLNITIPRH